MMEAFDKVEAYAEQIGIIMSVMDDDYEGGDFCQGLTATFELKSIAMSLVKGMFNKKTDDAFLQ